MTLSTDTGGRCWTLAAQLRPRGAEGHALVVAGPPIPLYTRIEVVPAAEVERLREENARLLADLEHMSREHLLDVEEQRGVDDEPLSPTGYYDADRVWHDDGWSTDPDAGEHWVEAKP